MQFHGPQHRGRQLCLAQQGLGQQQVRGRVTRAILGSQLGHHGIGLLVPAQAIHRLRQFEKGFRPGRNAQRQPALTGHAGGGKVLNRQRAVHQGRITVRGLHGGPAQQHRAKARAGRPGRQGRETSP